MGFKHISTIGTMWIIHLRATKGRRGGEGSKVQETNQTMADPFEGIEKM